eukprot:4445674-Ditylum_brightwellii.AAC.1
MRTREHSMIPRAQRRLHKLAPATAVVTLSCIFTFTTNSAILAWFCDPQVQPWSLGRLRLAHHLYWTKLAKCKLMPTSSSFLALTRGSWPLEKTGDFVSRREDSVSPC